VLSIGRQCSPEDLRARSASSSHLRFRACCLRTSMAGPLSPTGAPNYYVGLADSTHLNFFRFHVDFKNPANSSFRGPTLIAVAPYSEICARALNVSCIPQPSPGERVDALADRVMFRLAYRNFGDHESLVVNHTVKGGPLGAIRWYEIRNPSSPFVYQQSTIIDPSVDYWLGSIAMDKTGNIALGFSASSQSLFPSVYVAGRAPTNPPSAMFGPLVLVNGSGVQFNSYHRWGDYSAMTLDPTDDCMFWYTNEYYAVTGSFNWATRIGSSKFDSCRGTWQVRRSGIEWIVQVPQSKGHEIQTWKICAGELHNAVEPSPAAIVY
jgi:hypothetical protein